MQSPRQKPPQTATLEWITPHQAYEYLAANSDRQRNKIKSSLEEIIDDMKSGNWVTTHQGVAFDADGVLIDGQHRLTGLFESEIPGVWMWVFRGLEPENAMRVVDSGRQRSTANSLKAMGMTIASNDTVAVARFMMSKIGGGGGFMANIGKQPTDSVFQKFITDHADAIALAQSVLPKRLGPAGARAVLAKASYHVAEPKIRRFGLAIDDMIPAAEITECDRMTRKNFGNAHSSKKADRMEFYSKMHSIVHAYVENRAIAKIYEAATDPFPLPEGTSL